MREVILPRELTHMPNNYENNGHIWAVEIKGGVVMTRALYPRKQEGWTASGRDVVKPTEPFYCWLIEQLDALPGMKPTMEAVATMRQQLKTLSELAARPCDGIVEAMRRFASEIK